MDYRAAVAEYLDVTYTQVEAARIEDGAVVCLVNYGIGGTKKFSLSRAELTPVEIPQAEAVEEPPVELIVSPEVVERPTRRRRR